MLNTNDPTAMVMAQQLIEAAQYQQTQNHSAAAAAAAGLYASRAHHQPIHHHQQAPPQPAAAYFINPFVSNPQTAAATLLPFETTNGTNNAAAAVASNGYHHHNHHHLQTTTAPANPFNAAAMAAAAAQYAVGVPTLQFLAAAAAAAGTPGPFNSGATRADRLEVCQQYLRGTCPNDDSKCALAHPPLTCPIDRSNGQVTVCVDFVKQKCHREVCKYFHPPTHLVEQLRTGSGPANVPATPNAAVAAAALLNARRFMPPYAVAANPFVQHPYTHNHHQLLTSAANQLFRQQLPPANYQIDEKAPSSHHTNDTETSSNSSSTNSSGSSGKKRNYNESIREGDQSAANANDHHSFITSTPNSQCTPPKRPVIDSRLLAGEPTTTTMTNQIVSGRGGDRATVPSALMHQQGFFAGQNIHQLQLLHNLQLAYQQQQQNSIGFQQLASSQNPFMQTQLINMPYASLGGGGGGHPQFCYQLQPAMHPGQFVPQQQQQQLPQHHLHNAQQQQQIAAAPASAMAGQLHNAAAIPAAAAAATTGPAGVLYN